MLQSKNIEIHYQRYGQETKQPIVLLHGWGQNIEMMEPVGKALINEFDVILFDLPGFGKSMEPPFIWEVNDYVECIHDCLTQLKIENPILIGHSFGGKVSLLYASKYKVRKLVLLASPFKQEIKKLSVKTKLLKTLKQVPGLTRFEQFAKKHIGSTDYRNASPMMRDILVNTVNLDITEEVKKITCPTIMIWGTDDEQVDIQDAYELEKLIKDSAVIPYENCSHYAYLEQLHQTISVIESFIKE